MKKGQDHTAPAFFHMPYKGKEKQQQTPKSLVYAAIDRDTGEMIIEKSSSNRKIEPAPMGYHVRFMSLAEAMRLKKLLATRPYLVEKYLNSE